MDKQSNEKVYLKKCVTLCVTLLCVYGIPRIAVRIFVSLFAAHRDLQWFKTVQTVFYFVNTYALWACVILLIIFLFKRSRTCKNCKAWNSMKKINVELVGRQATTVKKTMQSKTEITDRCNQCGHTKQSNRSALFGA